jgi:hypothetical protein
LLNRSSESSRPSPPKRSLANRTRPLSLLHALRIPLVIRAGIQLENVNVAHPFQTQVDLRSHDRDVLICDDDFKRLSFQRLQSLVLLSPGHSPWKICASVEVGARLKTEIPSFGTGHGGQSSPTHSCIERTSTRIAVVRWGISADAAPLSRKRFTNNPIIDLFFGISIIP